MTKVGKMTSLLAAAAVFYAAPASAQATRTWVSGVGDDANPCSRTAPCKTFSGAISKTATGGEINCIDPGGFGQVTIIKSITIDCRNTEAGVLASGSPGIIINIANPTATDVVVLRGLDIDGASAANFGVRVLSANAVHIEDCLVRRFNGANAIGIQFAPTASTAVKLSIDNTTITDNGSGSGGGGVIAQLPAGATGTGTISITRSHLINNTGSAFKIDTTGNTNTTGVTATLTDSDFTDSSLGIGTVTPAGSQAAQVMVVRSTIARNAVGILGNGAGGTIRVSQATITNNGTGVMAVSSALVKSYGDNLLDGNPTPGAFTAPNLTKN